MHDEAFERIELKVAFLERANQDLSDVVYRQQQQIDQLNLQIQHLLSRLQGLQEEPTTYTAEQERPPHY
jgi:SlyX protein